MAERLAVRLGRKGRSPRKVTDLHFADYVDLDAVLASVGVVRKPGPLAPLADLDWTRGAPVDFGAMGNNEIGDCTVAAAAHMVQIWTYRLHSFNWRPDAPVGEMVTIPDADVVGAYSAITGYDPADPTTDDGAYLTQVLSYWRKVGIGGRKIAAYVAVDPSNLWHCWAACYLFGGLYTGWALPLRAAENIGALWDVVRDGNGNIYLGGSNAPGTWGGHCMAEVGLLSSMAADTLITWGYRQTATFDFRLAYCDEAWAVLSEDDLDPATGRNMIGLNREQLLADLQAVIG